MRLVQKHNVNANLLKIRCKTKCSDTETHVFLTDDLCIPVQLFFAEDINASRDVTIM